MARPPKNRLRWSRDLGETPPGETPADEPARGRAKPAGERNRSAVWSRWIPAVIVLAGLAAYGNSLHGVFAFDDQPAIVDNPHLRQFTSPSSWWADTTRPLVQFTLAANYANGGVDPFGYHVVNVASHLAAALVLFGLVRRVLLRPEMPDGLRQGAPWIAGAAALVWVVHPLTTASVTYLIQRSEVLMGLCYLAVLYAMVRAVESGAKGWYGAAIAACWLGMASKEVMVTAPVVALLFDRAYLAESWGEIARRRWGLYAGLASSWALLAVLMARAPKVFGTVGFTQTKVTAWQYAVNEPAVILHYVRLVFWPYPLVIDYSWPVTGLGENLAAMIVVAILVGLSLVLYFTRPLGPFTRLASWGGPHTGFLGLAFFLILAPTSSIVPIVDLAFEHRMYLPLAAVIVLVVLGGYEILRRVEGAPAPSPAVIGPASVAVMIVAAVLGALTIYRNADYSSELALWESAVQVRPANARAHDQLSVACLKAGRPDGAVHHAKLAVALEPDFAGAHNNLGRALDALHAHGFHPDSVAEYERAIELSPDYPDAHNNLANVLLRKGQALEALDHYRIALKASPESPTIHYHVAVTLAKLGEFDQALPHFQQAIALAERDPLANVALLVPLHVDLGETLALKGDMPAALQQFQQALGRNPQSAVAQAGLGKVLLASGKIDEAIGHLEKAIKFAPERPDSYMALARAFMAKGDPARAAVEYEQVLHLVPRNAEAHYFLGMCADEQGKPEDAIRHFREASQNRPGWAEPVLDLAWLLATNSKASVRDGAEAIRLIETYSQTTGKDRPRAWDTLAAAYAESGRYKDAVAAIEKGIDLADSSKRAAEPGHSGDDMQLRLQFYRSGAPYRAVRSE